MYNNQLIEKIITLANGPPSSQFKAVNYLKKDIFHDGKCLSHVDIRIVYKILPTIINFINSKNQRIKSAGAYFCTAITSNGKERTSLAMETGAISALIKLLSSSITRSSIKEEALRSLSNIAADFPAEVGKNGVLRPLMKCLKTNNPKVIYEAVLLMSNVSYKCVENVSAIIAAGGDEALMKLLDSKNRDTTKQALDSLINIISCHLQTYRQKFIQQNLLLTIIKKFSNNGGTYLAAQFINKIAKKINENIIAVILQSLNSMTSSDKIKILNLKIIKNVVKFNAAAISILVENNVISLVTNNLPNENYELTVYLLSTLEDLIHACGYENLAITLQRCNGSMKIRKLLRHENAEIQRIANRIHQFFCDDDIKPSAATVIDLCDEEGDEPAMITAESEENQQKRKYSFNLIKVEERKNSITPFESVYSSIMQILNATKPQCFRHTDTEQSVSPEGFEESNANDDGAFLSFRNSVFGGDVNTIAENNQANESGMSRKPSPVPFIIDYPLPPPTCSFDAIKYSCPSERFIKKCCTELGLQFDRKKYSELLFKIEFDTICSSSKPASLFETNDGSGFGCFSVIFTGREDSASLIKKKINEYFIDNRKEFFAEFDASKIIEVINSPTMTTTHLEAICRWFECRVIVCCNGTWTKHGQWDSEDGSEDNDASIFVLEKKECDAEVTYSIVLSLKN